jgi:hypothetical protein
MGLGGQRHAPAALHPGGTRYPLYRKLGGPQGRSGRVRKISPAPRFDPRIAQPIASRYTDWAIPAHISRHPILKVFTLIRGVIYWGRGLDPDCMYGIQLGDCELTSSKFDASIYLAEVRCTSTCVTAVWPSLCFMAGERHVKSSRHYEVAFVLSAAKLANTHSSWHEYSVIVQVALRQEYTNFPILKPPAKPRSLHVNLKQFHSNDPQLWRDLFNLTVA